MSFLSNLFNKSESIDANVIGTVECDKVSVTNIFLGLAQTMGMANVGMQAHSTTGISVKKKDSNTFEITLYKYNPPLVIQWSNTVPFNQLAHVIEKLSKENISVGAVNHVNQENGAFLQLGFLSID